MESVIEALDAISVESLSVSECKAVYNLSERLAKHQMDNLVGLKCPDDSREYLRKILMGRDYEVFGVVLLDNRHRVLGYRELFKGTIDGAAVYPREVVKAALEVNSNSVVLFHNHPSGIPEPSQADISLTRRLKEAFALIDVRVLDHFVVAKEGIISLAERGLI